MTVSYFYNIYNLGYKYFLKYVSSLDDFKKERILNLSQPCFYFVHVNVMLYTKKYISKYKCTLVGLSFSLWSGQDRNECETLMVKMMNLDH